MKTYKWKIWQTALNSSKTHFKGEGLPFLRDLELYDCTVCTKCTEPRSKEQLAPADSQSNLRGRRIHD